MDIYPPGHIPPGHIPPDLKMPVLVHASCVDYILHFNKKSDRGGVYVLGDKCPGGECPGGKCPGGICHCGRCPGGTCPGGYVLEPPLYCCRDDLSFG